MIEQAREKKILILYSKTGGGHLRVARSLEAQLKEIDPSCRISMHDGLEQTDHFGFRTNPARDFRILTTYLLPLYNAGYQITNNRPGLEFLRNTINLTCGKTVQEIIEDESPDGIVSTHHFLSPSTIKGLNPTVPFTMVVSDLGTPHRIWFDSHLHSIFVPDSDMINYGHSMVNENLAENGHKPKILDYGFPISAKVDDTESDGNTLLLMGGGSGTGNMYEQALILAQNFPGKRIIVVCGHNDGLKKKLASLANTEYQNLEVHGFITNIDPIIRQADMVIGKAGPNAIMEAVLHGKPYIATSSVGIQEEGNGAYLESKGTGISIDRLDLLPQAVNTIDKNYGRYTQRTSSVRNDGPQRIAQYILDSVK